MMKILLNLHQQWKKLFGWQQKTVTHTERQIYPKYLDFVIKIREKYVNQAAAFF